MTLDSILETLRHELVPGTYVPKAVKRLCTQANSFQVKSFTGLAKRLLGSSAQAIQVKIQSRMRNIADV